MLRGLERHGMVDRRLLRTAPPQAELAFADLFGLICPFVSREIETRCTAKVLQVRVSTSRDTNGLDVAVT